MSIDNMMWIIRPLPLAAGFLAVSLAAHPAWAQGGFDLTEWLKGKDKNNSGILEQDEIDDRTRDFLAKNKIDPSRPVSISDVASRISRDREAMERKRAEEEFARLPRNIPGFGEPLDQGEIPGFGVEIEETEEEAIPGFGVSDELALQAVVSIREQFGRRIDGRVENVFRRYDPNRDGILDAGEISKVPWSGLPWKDFDENSDGQLTKIELAKRYEASEERGDDRRGRRGSRRDSRDDDRRGRDRRSWGRDQEREQNDRSTNRSDNSSSRSSEPSDRDVEKRARDYARMLIKEKDENKNGKLDGDEVSGILRKADGDGDGEITEQEIFQATIEPARNPLSSRASSPTADSSRGRRSSTGRESRSNRASADSQAANRLVRDVTDGEYLVTEIRRIPLKQETVETRRVSQIPRSFSDKDRNGDGQIQLNEFADKLTRKTVEEFNELDANDDGVIHVSEWDR